MKRKDARNQALVAAYRKGASLAMVATEFGMSRSNAYRILELHDATPCYRETVRRVTLANQRKVTPEYRARLSATMRTWWAKRTGGNSPFSCSQTSLVPVSGSPTFTERSA